MRLWQYLPPFLHPDHSVVKQSHSLSIHIHNFWRCLGYLWLFNPDKLRNWSSLCSPFSDIIPIAEMWQDFPGKFLEFNQLEKIQERSSKGINLLSPPNLSMLAAYSNCVGAKPSDVRHPNLIKSSYKIYIIFSPGHLLPQLQHVRSNILSPEDCMLWSPKVPNLVVMVWH